MKDAEKDLTMGRVISGALVAPSDKKLRPTEAMDRYELAMDMRKNDEITLNSTQVKIIEEAVCTSYAPLVSGQVCKLLKAK